MDILIHIEEVQKFYKYVSGTIVILIISLFIYSAWVNGTLINADMYRGYEAMLQFNEGGSFNVISYPSFDISHYNYYVAWWAPGQWVVPWGLSLLFGTTNIQVLQSVIITLSLISSMFGYLTLFRRWCFGNTIVYVSLFTIITCQAFYSNALMYNGGTTLMLGFFPWFLLLGLKLIKIDGIRSWIGLIILALISCFIKNSFMILFLAFCFYAVFSRPRSGLKEVLKFVSIFSLVIVAVYWLHISRGGTPASSIDSVGFGDQGNSLWRDLFTSLGSPFSILFRYGLLDGSVVGFSGLRVELGEFMSWIPVLGTIILAFYFFKAYNLFEQEYSSVLLCFILPILLIFIPLYLLDLSISYEQRHFAPLVFLLVPGVLTMIFRSRLKVMLIVMLVGLNLYDLSFYFSQQQKMIANNSTWNSWRLPKEDVKILTGIGDWDAMNKNGLVLIEDNWLFNVAVRNSDKYVLTLQGEKWRLESGMELDDPDWFDRDFEMAGYSSILTISKVNKQGVDQLFKEFESTVVLETDHYILKERNPSTM